MIGPGLRTRLGHATTVVAALWSRRGAGTTATAWRLPADLGLLGVLAGIHTILGRAFLYAPIKFDEQFFLFEGFSLGRGLVPYRDFQELKPPTIFVVDMLALKLFGLHEMRFRYFFALLSLAAFLAVAIALLSRRVPRLIVLAIVALMMAHFFDAAFHESSINNSETAGVDFFLLGVAVLLFRGRSDSRLRPIAGGVLLAIATLSKEPFVVPVVTAWLALMALHGAESPEPSAWRSFARRTAAGAAGLGVVWLGYMLVTRSLGAYVTQLRQTMIYSAEHNVMYGVFPKLPFWGTWAECGRRLAAKYVNPAHMLLFVPFFAAALLLWRRRAIGLAASTFAVFLAGLYSVTIGHGFFGHYFIIGMTGTFYWATLGAVALSERLSDASATLRRWIGASLVLLVAVSLWPRLQKDGEQWERARPPAAPVPEALLQLVKQRTTPKDRIWNIGVPGVYVFAHRLSATRIPYMHDSLLHMYPGETDEQRLAPYRRELEVNMPKLVIVAETGPDRARHMNALVLPFLREHGYRPVSGVLTPPAAVYERPY